MERIGFDKMTYFEFALLEIKTKKRYGLFEYIEETAVETAIEAIEKQIPKQIRENYICPCCSSYNETIEKRANTTKNDICHCWHCGQALKF